MTIVASFVNYMQSVLSLGTLETDIFIGAAPKDAPDKLWWVKTTGGINTLKNATGEKIKQYRLGVYFRDIDPQNVDETLQDFEETINHANCDELTSFDLIEMEATIFPSDIDLDNEDRQIGLVEVTLTTHL